MRKNMSLGDKIVDLVLSELKYPSQTGSYGELEFVQQILYALKIRLIVARKHEKAPKKCIEQLKGIQRLLFECSEQMPEIIARKVRDS